jgi:hypothetical protein
MGQHLNNIGIQVGIRQAPSLQLAGNWSRRIMTILTCARTTTLLVVGLHGNDGNNYDARAGFDHWYFNGLPT